MREEGRRDLKILAESNHPPPVEILLIPIKKILIEHSFPERVSVFFYF